MSCALCSRAVGYLSVGCTWQRSGSDASQGFLLGSAPFTARLLHILAVFVNHRRKIHRKLFSVYLVLPRETVQNGICISLSASSHLDTFCEVRNRLTMQSTLFALCGWSKYPCLKTHSISLDCHYMPEGPFPFPYFFFLWPRTSLGVSLELLYYYDKLRH